MLKIAVIFFFVAICFAVPRAAFGNDFEKGKELYRASRYEEAITVLEKRVAEDGNDLGAWRYLGAAYLKLGRKDKAHEAFRNSTKNHPALKNNDGKEVPFAILVVEFRGDGKIGFVEPVTALPKNLTERAIAYARSMKFRPKAANGESVTEVRTVTIAIESL